jgi:hypothetical protein
MSCLNETQIQSVVDDEAAEDLRAHVASCASCRDRVRARAMLTDEIAQAINVPIDVPAALGRRITQALADGSASGATRLRNDRPPRRSWRPAVWSAGAVAAATIIAVMFVAPMFKAPSTVSAAAVLAKSVNRLSEKATRGVEFLEYELRLDGVPQEMMPDHADGAYTVKQVIDHETAGRYLAATYDAGGNIYSLVSQDPASNRRVMIVRLDGQPYRFEFTLPGDMTLSAPELERLHMQASVAMMQASGDQQLQVIDSAAGRQYRISVPRVAAETPNAVWDLTEAEVVVDANDYHIVEFAVKGTFLKQSYSVSYRLISRRVAAHASVDAGEFDAPQDPAAITIVGEGSAIPARDLLVVALRELAKSKQAR